MKLGRAGGLLRPPWGWRLICAAVVCLVFGREIITASRATNHQATPIASPTRSDSARPISGASSPAAQPAYPSIIAHPLFSASREPWVAPLPAAPPVNAVAIAQPTPSLPPPRNYALAGIVLSGMVHSALLRPANGGKTVVLSEGQKLDGWTLREIQQGRLSFEADGALFELAFPSAPKPGPR